MNLRVICITDAYATRRMMSLHLFRPLFDHPEKYFFVNICVNDIQVQKVTSDVACDLLLLYEVPPVGVLILRVTGRIIVSLYERASERVSSLGLLKTYNNELLILKDDHPRFTYQSLCSTFLSCSFRWNVHCQSRIHPARDRPIRPGHFCGIHELIPSCLKK